MNKEIFKDVPGYEGIYQVSNLGNVKSLKRIVQNSGSKSGFSTIKEKILKHGNDGKGYLMVVLYKNLTPKTFKVHQLVAMAFLNHIPNGHKIEIDHIDNNKLNNKLDNLQLLDSRLHSSKTNLLNKNNNLPTGVSLDKKSNKYISKISINRKQIHLGVFKTIHEASNAYINALNILNNGGDVVGFVKKSGLMKGVYFCGNKFRSCIRINGKLKHLGLFDTELEAHETYQKALKEVLCN
jgi:hypothetical protein